MGKSKKKSAGRAPAGRADGIAAVDAMLERLASQGLAGEFDLGALRHALTAVPSPVAVRPNPAKPLPASHGWGCQVRPVAWHPGALYLEGERPIFTLDPCFHQGRYYVQDPSSMYLARVLEAVGPFPEGVRYLDACAAPGGKTTVAADCLHASARITANELNPKRFNVLRENVAKWGAANVECTSTDASLIGGEYDIIAVDAPCSGEGMMRKETEARAQWSEALIEECAARQQLIVDNLWERLAPGGTFIYSTCTFNRDENDRIVERLVGQHGAVPLELPLYDGIVKAPCGGLRFIPGLVDGEGLFMAALRKPGELPARIPTPPAPAAAPLPAADDDEGWQRRLLGCQPLPSDIPVWPVDRPTALAFLRKEALRLPPEAPRGIIALTYEGLPLGRVKNIGSRANNLYPAPWRIRRL